jgi:hypothetical protein
MVQIIGDREMLVTAFFPRWLAMETVLLRGLDTAALTEDSRPPLGTYYVTGSYSYKGADGAQRTVFVVEPKSPATGRKR